MSASGIVVIVVLAVIVLAVVGALVLVMNRRRQRAGLQERFGPEYDRAVDDHDDRREAEKELADAADRRDALEIRDLSTAERDKYAQQWMEVQAAFVDDPGAATRDADRLIGAAMRDRGYPVEDFESRASMVAADNPELVEHYRSAHEIGIRTDEASTEELRRAFVHYRALFEHMLSERNDVTA